jgi:hypothetical protein
MMTVTLHDPTAELAPSQRPRRQPLDSLDGKIVALFDIGKPRSDEFLDSLEAEMSKRGIRTVRFGKPTNTRTAPVETLQAVATQAEAVVMAVSD